MATAPKTVRITVETALPELLDDAARAPIILERDGERFRLSRDEDIAYAPDPKGVRDVGASAGAPHALVARKEAVVQGGGRVRAAGKDVGPAEQRDVGLALPACPRAPS